MAKAKKKNDDSPKEMGRPTLYKTEYNDQVYKLCLLGATDKEIADFFEVAESTINNWKLEHPEFLESIRAGKIKADMEVASSMYQTTKDRVIIEKQAFKTKNVSWQDGKRIERETIEIVEVEKAVPANERNQQFWLKNRKGDQWRDKSEVENTNKLSFDTSALSDEDKERLFEISLKLKGNA